MDCLAPIPARHEHSHVPGDASATSRRRRGGLFWKTLQRISPPSSSFSTLTLLKEAKISRHAAFVYVVPSFPPFRVWSFKMLRRDLSSLAFHMCLFMLILSVCSCLTFLSTWPSIFSKGTNIISVITGADHINIKTSIYIIVFL